MDRSRDHYIGCKLIQIIVQSLEMLPSHFYYSESKRVLSRKVAFSLSNRENGKFFKGESCLFACQIRERQSSVKKNKSYELQIIFETGKVQTQACTLLCKI